MGDDKANQDATGDSQNKKGETNGASARRHIGEGVALLLYFIIDGYDIWPKSHLIALLSAVAGASAILFAELRVKVWAVWTVTLVGIAGIIYFNAAPLLPEETETHGWLLPAHDPTPPNGCESYPAPNNALLFIAGTNAAWTMANAKSDVIRIGNSSMLSVERDGSRLAFDADIYNEAGYLAVRINRNEFHLVSGEYSYQERSDNRSELTVYDKRGRKMLDVYYANPNTVLVRGFFTSPDGTRVQIDDKQITILDINNLLRGHCNSDFFGGNAAFMLSRAGMQF